MSEEVLEYATYAPSGTRCAKCGYPVQKTQMASRVSLGGELGYRHLQFSECRTAAGRRLAELRGSSK